MKQLHKVNVSSHSLWTVTEQSLLSSLPLFSISSASSSTNIFIDRVLKLLLLIMSYDHNKGLNYKKIALQIFIPEQSQANTCIKSSTLPRQTYNNLVPYPLQMFHIFL